MFAARTNPFRKLALLSLALVAVPVFPLLLLGLSFEDRIEQWVSATALPPAGRFGVIVGLLAGDILLPVPSSAVTTWGGGVLGVGWATLASTLGMSAGAAIGFALARTLGQRFVTGQSAGGDLDRAAQLVRRFGPVALVLTRPLPILAEACVLLVGTTGLPWRRFAVPVVLTNTVISATYAAAGAYFRDRGAFSPAIILSGTIPLLAALLARRWLPKSGERGEGRDDSDGERNVVEASKSRVAAGD